MRFYSVFADQNASESNALEQAVFIRHGFSWAAFLLFPLWSLYHRLWRPLLGWLVISTAVSAGFAWLSVSGHWNFLAGLAVALLFAMEAGAMRRARMARNNYAEIGQVSGRSLAECEIVFFTDYIGHLIPSGIDADVPSSQPAAT